MFLPKNLPAKSFVWIMAEVRDQTYDLMAAEKAPSRACVIEHHVSARASHCQTFLARRCSLLPPRLCCCKQGRVCEMPASWSILERFA